MRCVGLRGSLQATPAINPVDPGTERKVHCIIAGCRVVTGFIWVVALFAEIYARGSSSGIAA